MIKLETLDEETILKIGDAFSFYDCKEEHGLVDAFPNKKAVSAFICGYCKMALKLGMLYSTSEKYEGFIAYKLPKQKIKLSAIMLLAKGLFSSMKFKELIHFMRIMSKGGTSLSKQFDKKRNLIFMSVLFV